MSAHPQARLKQWSLLVGAGLVAGWLAFLAVGDVAEAVRYLSSQPGQLWILAAITLICGAQFPAPIPFPAGPGSGTPPTGRPSARP